jgi:hypothetical protein
MLEKAPAKDNFKKPAFYSFENKPVAYYSLLC